MASDERSPTFVFGPRSTKGIVLGLNAARLVALAAGLVAVVVSMAATSSLLVGFVPAAIVGVWVWLPVSGRSLADWAPVAGRFLSATASRSTSWTADPDRPTVPLAGTPPGRGRGRPPGARRPRRRDRRATDARRQHDRPTGPGGHPVGNSAPPGPAPPHPAPAAAATPSRPVLGAEPATTTESPGPGDQATTAPGAAPVTVAGAVIGAVVPATASTTEPPAPPGTAGGGRRAAVPSPDRPRHHRAPKLPPEWGSPGRWLDVVAGGQTVGLVDQRGASGRTITAVLAVGGKALALLSRGEQYSRAASWGHVVASLAYPGSCIRRVQVIERASPDVGQGQRAWLDATSASHDPTVREVYEQALDMTGRISAAHSVTLSIQCAIRRGDQAAGIRAVLTEIDALTANLRGGGFSARPLSAAEIAGVVRWTVDPPSGAAMTLRSPAGALSAPPEASGPMARHERWRTVCTDDAWHAVFVVSEYPRQEVYADWMRRLLLETVPGAVRTVSLLLEPVAPEAARRAAEQEVMGQEGSNEQRTKMQFRVAASARRQAMMAVAREEELADGHQLVRFGGVVGITARSAEALDRAVRQVDAAAGQSLLDLRRLYGQQAEALVALTPLARWRVRRRWE